MITFVFMGGAKEAYDSLISGITTGPMKSDADDEEDDDDDAAEGEDDMVDFEDKLDESM